MNIWKPIAIGCIGYIYGTNKAQRPYVNRGMRSYNPTTKDVFVSALSNAFYKAVFGETPTETRIRNRMDYGTQRYDRRFDDSRIPYNYSPTKPPYETKDNDPSYGDAEDEDEDEDGDETEN